MNDSRIPVVFGPAGLAGPHDVVLDASGLTGPAARLAADAAEDGPPHGAACACCRPRGALAQALGRLFMDRARQRVPPFSRVVVTGADPAVAARQIAADPLAGAWFRCTE